MSLQKFAALKGNIFTVHVSSRVARDRKPEGPRALPECPAPLRNSKCQLSALPSYIYTCLDFYSRCKRIYFSGTTCIDGTGNEVANLKGREICENLDPDEWILLGKIILADLSGRAV
jgi:hypothetical protein